MKPTIRTSWLSTSCITAGINPSSFVKSMEYHHKTKNPAGWRGCCRQSIVYRSSSRATPPAGPQVMRTMMVRVMVAGEHVRSGYLKQSSVASRTSQAAVLLGQRLAGRLLAEGQHEEPEQKRDRRQCHRRSDCYVVGHARADEERDARAHESADRRRECERSRAAIGRVLFRQPQRIHREVGAADAEEEEHDEEPGQRVFHHVEHI